MSVTLAVAIISLLPAAVSFHSHEDNVQWHFGEREKGESNGREKPTVVSDSIVKSNSGFWGLLSG